MTTGLLEKLISIPSFSKEEKQAADFLEGYLTEEGFRVNREKNNLWIESEAPADKPTILLNAHIDTVRPSSAYTRDPFTPFLQGDVLYGLGSNDDGASIVALYEAYKVLISTPQPYRLVLSLTAEEENGGRDGIETILPLVGKVDLGVIGEPTGMNMAVAEKGLMVLDCQTRGKSGHAAREEGINAIYCALQDIEWFRTFRFPKVSAFCGPVKMSVTQISAGIQHNVVPDLCEFVVDIRGNGIYRNADILEQIGRHVSCSFTPRSTRHNGASIPMDHPIVRKGLSLGLEAFGSPTTSNQSVCPFTTIKIGPGQSCRSHCADEFILISEIGQGIRTYIDLLSSLTL